MGIGEISLIIGIIVGISGVVFSVVSAMRLNKKDTEEKATSIAVLNSDIGYVKSGIDDIKKQQGSTDSLVRDLTKQVTQAEDRAKSAHKRIDMHEQRLIKLEHDQDS